MNRIALLRDVSNAFSPFYTVTLQEVIGELDLATDWFWLNMARGVDPAPLTVESVQAIVPYVAEKRNVGVLDGLVEKGFLANGNKRYRLTKSGRLAIESLFSRVLAEIGKIEIDSVDMNRLTTLLQQVVEATLVDEVVAEKPALVASRWTDPGQDAPLTVQIDQLITDLIRYRDDAHIAAWQPLGVSGPAWNVLTYVWRERAHTLAELVEQLAFTQLTEAELKACGDDLIARGWLSESNGRYMLTELGRQVREEAEVATDRYYDIGWSGLDESEASQLDSLLTHLRDALQFKNYQQVWEMGQTVLNGFSPHFVSKTNSFLDSLAMTPRDWFVSFVAYGCEGQSVTADYLLSLAPYNHIRNRQAMLEEATEHGFFTVVDGVYTLTESGRKGVKGFFRVAREAMAEIDDVSLTDKEVIELADLLGKVNRAVWEGEPAAKPRMGHNHFMDAGDEAHPLVRIDQYLTNFALFRDDVHVAAWSGYGVSGVVWESFTFVWREQAQTAVALAEQLKQRQHSVTVYAAALAELVERGWISEVDGIYQVTDTGDTVRREAEVVTDQLFFGGWAVLSANELQTLSHLLMGLADSWQREG